MSALQASGPLHQALSFRGGELGEGGAFATMHPHAIAVDCSTLSLDWIREWHTEAATHGVKFDAMLAALRTPEGERSIGYVYAWNTLGAIAGVFVAVHVGLPQLGLKLSLSAAALFLLPQVELFRLAATA